MRSLFAKAEKDSYRLSLSLLLNRSKAKTTRSPTPKSTLSDSHWTGVISGYARQCTLSQSRNTPVYEHHGFLDRLPLSKSALDNMRSSALYFTVADS